MAHESSHQEFLPVGDRVSIFQRGKAWYVNYQHDHRQVRRSLGTANKKEAILRAQRIEADLGRGALPDAVEIATISDVIAAWLSTAEAENKAPKTLTKYRFESERILKSAEEQRRSNISQVNAQFADAFRAQLKKAGKAPKTIYNALIILRSVTLYAVRRRMCDVDPLSGYKLRKPKPTPQPCWSPAEADSIVAAAPKTYRPYFELLRETGCRSGEAKYLTWNDVDFRHGVIHIRPKDHWKPKTGDQRKVPMTERARQLMMKLPRCGRWVFTAPVTSRYPEPGRQISKRRALQALKRVLTKLGLNGHLHTFRHTFISQALMAGIPEPVVREWVGHVDPAILRLYTHVSEAASQRFIARFSEPEPGEKPRADEVSGEGDRGVA